MPFHSRPISVINNDLKIFGCILADRLASFITSLISLDQTSFIPSRQITDNIHLPLNVIQDADIYSRKDLLLSLSRPLKTLFGHTLDTVSAMAHFPNFYTTSSIWEDFGCPIFPPCLFWSCSFSPRDVAPLNGIVSQSLCLWSLYKEKFKLLSRPLTWLPSWVNQSSHQPSIQDWNWPVGLHKAWWLWISY